MRRIPDVVERVRRYEPPERERRLALWAVARAAMERRASWMVLAGSFAIVFLLYGRALRFSFLFDDTIDLTRVEGRSYWSLLASSEGYSYYRPLPFLIWKALRDVQGYYDQATLHALPLIVHAISGWLLYVLVRRLGAGHWAVVPALLFVTAPFHYQSVPIVGTLFHPLAGMAILSSLTLFHKGRTADFRRSLHLHSAALAMTVIALWAHESGIVIGALIVGLEGLVLWRARRRRPSLWVAAHVVAALAFFVVWSTVEKAPFGERTNLDELHPKALFFLQGFTYPLSAQIVWIEDHLGVSVGIVQVALLAFVGVIAAYFMSGKRSGRPGQLAIPIVGIGIALIASAPSLARLSWPYVQNSPRLLYLVMIGSALFWGLLPSLRFGHARFDRAWRIVTIALLLGVVVQSWRFVDVRMEMIARGSATIDAIVAEGQTYRGQRLLYLNAPSWFAQGRYEYPYGHFGVQLVPQYIGFDRLIYTSSEQATRTDARSVSWQPPVSDGVYPFGPHGSDAPPEELDALLREGRELVRVWPAGNKYLVRTVGRLDVGRADVLPEAAGRLAGGIYLDPVRVGMHDERLIVFVDWNAVRPDGVDNDTVIELRDADGETVERYEGYALAGFSAPRLWQPGDRIADSVSFAVPPPGRYSVWVGLERVKSNERAPAIDGRGAALPDGMLPIGEIVAGSGRPTVARSGW